MLRIKKAQMDALAERDFVAATAAHLAAWFPRHRVVASDAGLREVARRALARSRAHGLVSARSATTIAELMCMLGASFGEDPLLPWAARALADERREEADRIDRLHAIAMRHLDAIAADAEGLSGAMAAARAEPNTPLASPDAARPALFALVATHLPRRGAILGSEGLRGMADRAVAEARRLDAATQRGVVALGALAFTLGSGFLVDPLVPALGEALRDGGATEPAARVDDLFDALRRTIGAWTAGAT